jgi:hypothetical protein
MASYSTKVDWDKDHNVVILSRDGVEVASMSLDEWMELSAVRYAAEELTHQAAHSASADTAAPAAT